jgi:uncharacterized membrane protein YwaF
MFMVFKKQTENMRFVYIALGILFALATKFVSKVYNVAIVAITNLLEPHIERDKVPWFYTSGFT